MANVSTARKLGVVARVAGQQLKQTRTYGAVRSGTRAAFSRFGEIFRQLWHEVTGFVFLAIAAAGVAGLVRAYAAYHVGKGTPSRVVLAAGFTLMFAWFGVSSFARARKRR
jgi:putative exporter of polyketide antibiotics